MFGCYRHTLDSKGRLFIPSKLKDEIGAKFHVAKNKKAGCLTIYPESEWQKVMARLDGYPASKVAELRFFFANVTEVEVDKQGRFLLPEGYRTFAGLSSEVVFAGIVNCAEIWSAERYDAAEAAADAAAEAGGENDQDKMEKFEI